MYNFCCKILLILFLISGLKLQAQEGIKILAYDTNGEIIEHSEIGVDNKYPSVSFAEQALQKSLLKYYQEGFLTASFDELLLENDTLKITFYKGNSFEWVYLKGSGTDDFLLSRANFRDRNYTQTTFNPVRFTRLVERILKTAQQNGYPFAQVTLDSVDINGNQISAVLNIQKNNLILYDTITLDGEPRINKNYLANYLNLREGKVYDERDVQRIQRRIRDLPFLEETRDGVIFFTDEKARPMLFLRNRNASRLNFLVGVLPNNEITGRVILTGEANLELLNPFGRGTRLNLDWQRLQARTQSLEISFHYPYLFNLPFGADINFELYKRDTLYIDLHREIGIQYMLGGNNYLEGFFKNSRTNILTVDTQQIKQTLTLPSRLDRSENIYGIKFNWEELDYRLNPRHGWTTYLEGGVGRRSILTNNIIASLNDPENPDGTLGRLYDDLEQATTNYRLRYHLRKFWPVTTRFIIKNGIRGGAIITNAQLLENELYIIGGNRILRGFDEASIFASQFHIFTLETRYILEENSYAYFFADAAFVENPFREEEFRIDFPIGFGAGIAFETQAGIFAVSYALGKQLDNPLNFRSGKIHFGYRNYF